MCTKNHNHMMYGSWDTEWDRQNFLSFWTAFCPFTQPCHPLDLENQHFEKIKKTSANIIILQMCTINDSYMMYGPWDKECNGQNFLSFWTIFCAFTPLTTRKIKILRNWKKRLEISSFYTSVLKIMIMWYTIPYTVESRYLELWRDPAKSSRYRNFWDSATSR